MIAWFNERMLIYILIIASCSSFGNANHPVSLSTLTADNTVAAVRYVQLEMPTRTVEIQQRAVVEPKNTVWITSPAEGEMYQQLVVPGTRVKPGDVLAKVSANPITVNKNFSEQASDYKQQYGQLTNHWSPTGDSEAELIFQQARIDAVREREKIVHENESKGNLVSHLEGVVYKIARPLNTSINKGERVVAIAQSLEITANLDEQSLNAIAQAERVTYHITTPSKVIPVFRKNKDRLTNETGSSVRFTTPATNFTYLAEKPEWSLTLNITQHAQATSLRIPHESLHVSTEDPNTWFVWIIDSEHHQLVQRSVKVGELFQGQTTITEGLTGTERLVTSAPPWARAGMNVSTIEQNRGAINR